MPYKDPATRRVKHAAYRRKRRALNLEPKQKHAPDYLMKQKEYRMRPEVRSIAAERARKWTAANPEKRRLISRRNILKRHGLTIELFDAMVAAQNGVCAICHQGTKSLLGEYLSVDHCHKTGFVRGLLCGSCNTLIGQIDDSIDILESMISYIRRNAPTREDAR